LLRHIGLRGLGLYWVNNAIDWLSAIGVKGPQGGTDQRRGRFPLPGSSSKKHSGIQVQVARRVGPDVRVARRDGNVAVAQRRSNLW
jgi:hypothetical protein